MGQVYSSSIYHDSQMVSVLCCVRYNGEITREERRKKEDKFAAFHAGFKKFVDNCCVSGTLLWKGYQPRINFAKENVNLNTSSLQMLWPCCCCSLGNTGYSVHCCPRRKCSLPQY